mgnify:CR=1 FL=1
MLESRAQPPSLDTLATQKEIRQERRELENLQNQVNAKRENIAQREEESKRMHEKLADQSSLRRYCMRYQETFGNG